MLKRIISFCLAISTTAILADVIRPNTSVVGTFKPNGGLFVKTCARSANYTITDTDGCAVIAMTTGASDRTITLPSAANNIGRAISFVKVDSGTGKMIVSRAGSDVIDGLNSITMYYQYGNFEVTGATSSIWTVSQEEYETKASLGVNFFTAVGARNVASITNDGGAVTRRGDVAFFKYSFTPTVTTPGIDTAWTFPVNNLPYPTNSVQTMGICRRNGTSAQSQEGIVGNVSGGVEVVLVPASAGSNATDCAFQFTITR
jgi:hypothetical protein